MECVLRQDAQTSSPFSRLTTSRKPSNWDSCLTTNCFGASLRKRTSLWGPTSAASPTTTNKDRSLLPYLRPLTRTVLWWQRQTKAAIQLAQRTPVAATPLEATPISYLAHPQLGETTQDREEVPWVCTRMQSTSSDGNSTSASIAKSGLMVSTSTRADMQFS